MKTITCIIITLFLFPVLAIGQNFEIATLSQQANEGNALAQRNLAYCYQMGIGTIIDYSKAFKLYKTASTSIPTALNDLGWCYEHGFGTRIDSVAAVNCYLNAAQKADPYALYNLSRCYEYGIGIKQDIHTADSLCNIAAKLGNPKAQLYTGLLSFCQRDSTNAIKWVQLAAHQNYIEAQFVLGCFLYNGIGIQVNHEEAVKWWNKSVRQNHTEAEYNLAWCCEHGDGVEQDMLQAIQHYKKAANAGEADAQYRLGCLYYSEEDYNKAFKWFNEAQQSGNLGGAAMLGECYYYGYGVEKDYDEAYEWLSQAVEKEQGYINAKAMRLLSACYRLGRGTEIDQEKANKLMILAAQSGDSIAQKNLNYSGSVFKDTPHDLPWLTIGDILSNRGATQQSTYYYQQAAQAGILEAQNKLAYAHYKGIGVPCTYSQAARWFRLAAGKDYAPAQYGLAYCYLYARGVPRNHNKSIELLTSSADKRYVPALIALSECYDKGVIVKQDKQKAQSLLEAINVGILHEPPTGYIIPDNTGCQFVFNSDL